MSSIAEYTNITYLIEIIAIGLVSLALIAVVTAIFFRQWSGKAEHKNMLLLRDAVQYEKDKVDITIGEIIKIEQQAHDNLAITKSQLQNLTKQQQYFTQKSKEIELRADHIKLLEREVLQTAEVLSQRINNIEKHWDKQLEHTVQTVDQISGILEENLKHIKNQNIVANNLTQSLTTQYDDLQLEKKQVAIQTSIDTTLNASTQLNTQLEQLQQKAEYAFAQFNNKLVELDLNTLEKPPYDGGTHIVFDDIDAIAPSVKEQSFHPVDEALAPAKNKTTATVAHKQSDKRPHLDTITTTDNLQGFFPTNKKKVNE